MNTEYKKGIFLALSAYILWGILPIYWQFVDAIGAFEILAFRIIFSVIFMIFILAVGQKQRNAFQRDMNQLLAKPIQLLAIVVAGYVITLNWGTFIWAVTNGHVLQTSLGYYINPLVSILLALIFLKERFNKFEWLAILFAFIGVLYMTLKIGEFPIVIYVIYLWQQHQMSFGLNMSSFWLLFSGAITAIPLILFSAGAKRIPLSLIGFIQYVGPTIMFVLGIFVFKEPFSIDQLITFIFIWTGIVLYSLSQYIKLKKHPVAKTL
ncbi:DMT superfamily drug/metabolite transporter [Staphylococcus aureus]|nr:DMT superfamily drug/metabolite transporter [Staphylococcus aureus]